LRKYNQQLQQPVANKVYELRITGALVNYLHKALFSPTKSALLQAVKNGHLITWPGLTEEAIHKHLRLTPATAMGHMNQSRQNIRSTSKTPVEYLPTTDMNIVHKNPLGLCRPGRSRSTLHRLEGKIPGEIQQGQLIRHGLLRL
jgi:hypothetical protein